MAVNRCVFASSQFIAVEMSVVESFSSAIMELHELCYHQHILNGSFAVHCHSIGHGTWIWPFSFLPVFIAAFALGVVQPYVQVSSQKLSSIGHN